MDNKIYLNVPYSEKDEAKSKGARWDPNEKSGLLLIPIINYHSQVGLKPKLRTHLAENSIHQFIWFNLSNLAGAAGISVVSIASLIPS